MAELSSHDWGESSVADRDQMHRLLVLREQILLKEGKARQLGLDLPLHEERGLSLENDQQGEITIARLSGYLDILTQALEKTGQKPAKITAERAEHSREQAEHWLYELLFRAEQFFPEALKAIKPGMIADTAPFPLEELVKQLHGDQKLLPAERRHLDEVILAVRLRWDRLVRGQLKLSGEKHFTKREAAHHLLQDTELWRIIFSEKVLSPVFKKIPSEVLAAAAAEAFVSSDFTHAQIREAILSSLPEETSAPLRQSREVSPELFERLVKYFLDKGEALKHAYTMVSRVTHPESFQRVVAAPKFIERLRDDFAIIEPPNKSEKWYRA